MVRQLYSVCFNCVKIHGTQPVQSNYQLAFLFVLLGHLAILFNALLGGAARSIQEICEALILTVSMIRTQTKNLFIMGPTL